MKEQLLYARQPIFDVDNVIYGFELLYRDSVEDAATFNNGDVATAQLLSNLYTGLAESDADWLSLGPLFFNLTANLLLSDAFFPIKPHQAVIEILEDIEPTEVLLKRIAMLRRHGYRFALDDYVFEKQRKAFIPFVDFIKVDVLNLDIEQYATQIQALGNNRLLIAEKVEDRAMYQRCLELGFSYFQGYYLAAPNTYKGKTAVSFKSSSMNILAELQSPDLTVNRAAELISCDVNLVFKLIKLVNSSMFPAKNEITHLRQAVIMLGLITVRKWVTVMVLISESSEPPELFRILLTRARACETIAAKFSLAEPEKCFTMGLLSGIGIALGVDTRWILEQLKIDSKIVLAILHETGNEGSVLLTVKAMEQANWKYLNMIDPKFRDQLSELYLTACIWADELMDLVN